MFISFLGIGQGGSNICDEWAKRGHYSAAINFSQRDLESLEFVENKLHLIGSEGIGKQRNNAISLMNNNWDLAMNFVKENFSHSSIEIVFVPFATGGGSGSGVAPVLLQLLSESMPEKVFVAMPILPDKNESFISQKNCLETFEDLSSLDICILPIDNDKTKSILPNKGKNNLFNKVNESVATIIEQLISYTDKSSKYGVLDRKDLRSIFSTKGVACIAQAELSNLSNSIGISEDGFTSVIQESWGSSIFADIEYDQILSAGIIFDGQEALMEMVNVESAFSKFHNKMPISLYEGNYIKEKGGKIISVLTGLAWCNTRLRQIDEIVTQTSRTFESLNQSTVYKSKISDMPLPMDRKDRKDHKVKDISDIISKFKR